MEKGIRSSVQGDDSLLLINWPNPFLQVFLSFPLVDLCIWEVEMLHTYYLYVQEQ